MLKNNFRKIAIDIDDVITDSTKAFVGRVNGQLGTNLTLEDYHDIGGDYRGYYERVWQAHGLSGRISHDELDEEMVIDQSHIPLLPGAEFALKQLTDRYHVTFITARDARMEEATKRWFKENLDNSDIELYFSEATTNISNGRMSKGQLCEQLGISLLIDDNMHHCKTALDEGIEAILFGEYGWSRDVPEDLNIIRCKDWQAVLEYLDAA